MSSTIKVNNIQNLAGDDSGIDLSTNDQIILKTANTTAITVDSSQAVTNAGATTINGALSAKGGVVFNEDSADVDFRVESNNSANMFFIDGGNDRIKINTDQTVSTAAAETFAVDAGTSGGYGGVFSSNTSGGFSAIFLKAETNVSNLAIFAKSSSTVGSISTNGSSTSFNTSSDARLKENVEDMTGAIDRVKQLLPKRFNFIADDTNTLVDGFLAHEAQNVVAESVTGTHNEVDDDGNAVMQAIDQAKIVPLLTGALKEAIAKIEALETRITALESE